MLKAAKTVAARRADTLSVSDASHGPFSVEDYRNVLAEAKDYIRFINASDYSVVVSHIDLILSAPPIFLPSDPSPSQHLRADEPQSETANPERVYFLFVRGDAFGQDENRMRIRKWDTKTFDGASEYVFSPAHHATGSREAARQEAVRLIEHAGLEMEEEYDLLVDDISETMLRFAAIPSPQEHVDARHAFDEWCKDRDLIRASLRDAFEAGFLAAPSPKTKGLESDPATLRGYCQQLLDILENYQVEIEGEDNDLVAHISRNVDPAHVELLATTEGQTNG